jgi:xanthine dehydrogenase accessory factor
MRLDLLSELNAERAARRAAVVITDMASGAQRLVRETEIARDPLADQLRQLIALGKSARVESEAADCFIELHLPATIVVIIGAVHITQTLAPMARMLGYEVTIIDPRTGFATPERFPQTTIVTSWPDQAFAKIRLDRRTALIALTHDPKIDDPAIETALQAGCFYVGALGSRKTHAKRFERLQQKGLNDEMLARIRAPIGLAIGAATPAEISISILAQLTETLRKTGQP